VSQFSLTAARPGVTSVSVDDQTLALDGEPVSLNADQVERVSSIPGVELTPAGKAKSPASTTGGSSASTEKG
jgi:hypothetical protein